MPIDADEVTINTLCTEHTVRLEEWIAKRKEQAGAPADPVLANVPRYDGTIYAACQIYQKHPYSEFHTVKPNTRKGYVDSLKIIEATVGKRVIPKVTLADVKHWYREWRKPAAPGGPERIRRAHGAISMLRTVLWFCAALRHKECKALAGDLKGVQFERAGAREQEMTYAHVTAFVRAALELGGKGIMAIDRARYMAIGTAAQFELMLRQKDIIGEWSKKIDPGAKNAMIFDGEMWTGQFTWEAIPGWRWRMRTSKSKYRAAAEFYLDRYGLLFPLLEAVPHDQRTGPIVKGEHGLPMRENSYRKWFRQIREAAGIPSEVWNMDTRAGGATEADEAGADLDAIQAALTHSKKEMSLRYIRRRTTRIASVADARERKRAADEEKG